MERLSPIEIRVKALVQDFFADKITPQAFKRELAREKVGHRPKQRRLPKARGKIGS